MAKTPEKQEHITATYIGRLEALGLGSVDGIPTKLEHASDADIKEYGEFIVEALKPITDFAHDGCIDGRHTKRNHDGSDAQIRERHVSGSGSNTEIAMNAQASIIDTVDDDADLKQTIHIIDDFIEETTGKKRSAHMGGCGGTNGAIIHNQLIATDQTIIEATKAVLELPAATTLFGARYDETLGQAVVAQSDRTAMWLTNNGWDGQAYVDGVAREEPSGVEELHVMPDAFHGHAEDAVVLNFIEGQSIAMDNVFVIDMPAIKKKAEALAGSRGMTGYVQALIADVAKHMAVAKVLPSTATPVYIVA